MAVDVDLTTIWAFIIAFAVFAYVVMDGFDLGIGILFPFLEVGTERDRAMNSIAPVWDGNETWLVLGGGGLFAAFPLAYAVILPATYPLIIAMLLGLVFRGVAFEYRWRDPRHRRLWDWAFTGGSLVAATAQGMTLGALLQGITVVDRAYAGSWFDWLTPYTLLTGLGTAAGYALLGGTWLVWKLDGAYQAHARRLARLAAWATLMLMGAVSLYNLLLNAEYASRWLTTPEIWFAAPVPILTGLVALALLRALAVERHSKPFWLSIALFFLGMAGLGVTMWPYVVPPSITIWDAAAPERSQWFMLIGVAITMPLILAYTVWAYWVFRGKVGDEGYH
ncbi:cytochrome d ubiquinol oxidase subunit II [Erythrobacter arachoides]|uniref:Cytochrome d ubiquinol oxidase subunit II n=1 Tax=Aurantiacibacter arachoides TaxID=1850444 RepID=A0A845A0H4_9SPHN|nr:cytochrome d ubiquinol oxidase subunit II [Aurantiacibacter arachoides]MXO94031.1 cytochrome d ubiquinol oxidase subunit II [Aurantiacibacter arachoides]GGD44619.1 ubiquinol oxidase subunit II, cyanide insensitive [Aurantiacibacter arachoides]